MPLLYCTYPGEPRQDMEDAIATVAERFGGEPGDSGWCSNERDVEVRFGRRSKVQKQTIAAEMLAVGCTRADW